MFSKDFSTVLNFSVDCLTRDLLVSANCWDLDGNRVYHFNTVGRHEPFNIIYPGLLLDGSWSWPRAEEIEVNVEDRDEHGGQDQAAKPSKQAS